MALFVARHQHSEALVFLTHNPEQFLQPNFDVSPREKMIALQRVVQYYQMAGKPEAASKWQKETDTLAASFPATTIK